MSENARPAGSTRATAQFEVADDEGSVAVRKLVSKGERLEIDSGTDSVKLDALLLEGLSWQPDTAALYDLLDSGSRVAFEPVHGTASGTDTERSRDADPDPVPGADPDPVPGADEVSISNEYSLVTARKVLTDAGEALELATPGRGTTMVLDAATLRDLAAVEDTYVFSVWFKTPFGPEDAPLEGPL